MRPALIGAIGMAAVVAWLQMTAAIGAQSADPAHAVSSPSPVVAPVVTPPDYTIGPDDVLTIVFWRQKDMSTDVVVRPDGKITLPLLNDVQAAALTPDQLRQVLTERAAQFVEDPTASVVVKQINSRRVFITGNVEKAGPYAVTSPMTVVQLIALAGGLREFADGKHIVIVRNEGGRPVSYPFSYRDVAQRKNLKQNIELQPGDTVIVP